MIKIPKGYLDIMAKDIDRIYVFTKTYVICKGGEYIAKNSLGFRRNSSEWDSLFCIGLKKHINDGTLPRYDFKYFDGYVRPLSQHEKYELLMKYVGKEAKKLAAILKEAQKALGEI